jgi:hypothetical protein
VSSNAKVRSKSRAGRGDIKLWTTPASGPRRAFARKNWKIQTKSPMCQKRSKSFSSMMFSGRGAMRARIG